MFTFNAVFRLGFYMLFLPQVNQQRPEHTEDLYTQKSLWLAEIQPTYCKCNICPSQGLLGWVPQMPQPSDQRRMKVNGEP